MGDRLFAMAMRWTAVLLVVGMGLAGNASGTLLDRGPDMVYDDVLNITWTRQAGDGVERNWDAAHVWAAGLVIDGVSGWRLPWESVIAGVGPTTTVVNCATATELECRDNEMGYMFYYDLGGTLGQNKTGNQTALGGQMLTLIRADNWSGTVQRPGAAWLFDFALGQDFILGTNGPFLDDWAVHPGDVMAAVPEPATLALLILGFAGLGFSHRKQ